MTLSIFYIFVKWDKNYVLFDTEEKGGWAESKEVLVK